MRARFEELDADQDEQERDRRVAADEIAVRLRASRARRPPRTARAPTTGMRAGGARGRGRSRRSSSEAHADEQHAGGGRPRSAGAAPAASAPRAAARRASGSAPASAVVCDIGAARALQPRQGLRNVHVARLRAETARARSSASRRWSRPWRAGKARAAAARSANGRAARSAASTHAVRRDSRASTGERARQRVPRRASTRSAAAARLELLRVPAGAARDRFPRDALRRIAALEFAQSREIRVVARGRAPAASGAAVPRGSGGAPISGAGNTMPASGKCTYAQPRHSPNGNSDDSVTRPSAMRPRVGASARRASTVSAAPARRRRHAARRAPRSVIRVRAARAAVQRERERHVAAGERLARGQRRDLDAREVAERVQQRGGDESGEQERDAEAERQRVVERRRAASSRASRSTPSRAASAGCRCASGAARPAS